MVAVSQKFFEFRRGRQLGDPGGAAAGGRLISRPYRCGGNRGLAGRLIGDPYGALQNLGAVAKSHSPCRGRQPGDPGGIRSEKMPPAHRRSEPVRWGTECSGWGHQRLYLPFLPFFLPLLAVFTSSAPVASMARIITTISTPKMLLPSVA